MCFLMIAISRELKTIILRDTDFLIFFDFTSALRDKFDGLMTTYAIRDLFFCYREISQISLS